MLYPYISQFNWIDILLIICILRMCFIGSRRGIGIELFKAVNLCFCAFVALHFYFPLGEFIHIKIPALPLEAAAIFNYVILLVIITIIFKILRDGILIFFKGEAISPISKYLGLIFGFIRGAFISGLIIFGLLISTIHYFELSARTSFFGSKIVKFPMKTYEIIFHGIVAKAFPNQSINQEALKTIEGNFKRE